MFGLLAPGRHVTTQIIQTGESVFLMQVENTASINHLCIFLTGTMPFTEGLGGSIHIGWPPNDGTEPAWEYLGYISNEKPSALFRIHRRQETNTSQHLNFGGMGANNIFQTMYSENAIIAISVEQLTQILAKVPSSSSQPITLDFQTLFTQKIIDSFKNYALSFAISPFNIKPTMEDFIPAKAIDGWYHKFQKQLQEDPDFWKK